LNYDGTAIASVPGVPHNPMPEADGTGQNIAYGSSPIITRLDGYGNGNRSLELTQASKDYIINNGYMETPSYTLGRGPVNIKVVDPLNVVDGYFECIFNDYATSITNGADTASWTINRYDVKGGTLKDSYTSDVTISSDNEQIIPDWGVSVQIYQNKYFSPEGSPAERSTDLISAEINFADSSKRWMTFVQDNDAFYPTNWIRSGTYAPETDPTDPAYECLDDTQPGYRDYIDPCNYADQNGADNEKRFAKLLGGGVAPHRVAGYEASYMPMAYYNYNNPSPAKDASSISYLPSVDIVLTADQSKWTRCPIIELGRSSALNVGGAEPGEMRKSPSVGKDGNPDGTGTGMGWFPGYAIDLESGARLYMAFGENSFLVAENGSDMIWNPTSNLIDNAGTPLMGGMHPVYVFSYNNKTTNKYLPGYDHPAYIPSQAENNATNQLYQDMLVIESNSITQKRYTYGSISWVAYPMLQEGQDLLSTDVTISLRVNKEYKNFVATGENGGKPMYSWDMSDIATETGSQDRLVDVLDMINVVPNPYYAYSDYEKSRLDSRVKITNLPEKCTVKIYSVNGKLVRTFKKDSPITSLDWDLNNHKGIPIAGGVYLIHVDVPDVGEVIVKFFGGMRQIDLQGI
ncbi:MAG: T9SS C-terminal target domain-containing protein, partial [Crocinitomicaceae bacterium]|nr:T9SS C-terminal target domain-containing protein [Crocinitomicaceae bacterium]